MEELTFIYECMENYDLTVELIVTNKKGDINGLIMRGSRTKKLYKVLNKNNIKWCLQTYK